MKIVIPQLNLTVGDCDGNAYKIIRGYQNAVEKGAELVVLSEQTILGYPPKDLLFNPEYLDDQSEALEFIKYVVGDIPLIIGVAARNPGPGKALYNCAIIIRQGKIVMQQGKYLLPTYDVFDERRYFEPNTKAPKIFRYKGRRIGILICEDIWGGSEESGIKAHYSVDPVARLKGKNPDLLIMLNASPYYQGKARIRYDPLESVAVRLGCPVVYANQVGGNDDLIFDGRSFAVSACGECIAAADPFAEELLIFDDKSERGGIYPFGGSLMELKDALVLGIRDYFKKTGNEKGAVIALSGGIDSALVAWLAVEALGPESVLAVAMPSLYSSKESVTDAAELARNLGIGLEIVPISGIYDAYAGALVKPIGWNVPGAVPADVTEENIQARIRGNLIMAFSNRLKKFVLSTGNKSELAIGYCTLYGDMSGGLGVISDIPKTLVYKLANFINMMEMVSGRGRFIPVNIISKKPSAELSPGQTDQDTLPPYPVLDQILMYYIDEGKTAKEIIELGIDEEAVRWVLRRVDCNEFKRRQAPPGLKVSPKAFGAGRRMPIACK